MKALVVDTPQAGAPLRRLATLPAAQPTSSTESTRGAVRNMARDAITSGGAPDAWALEPLGVRSERAQVVHHRPARDPQLLGDLVLGQPLDVVQPGDSAQV